MSARFHNPLPHGLPHVIVPGSRVRQSAEVAPVGVPQPAEPEAPTVELIKDGDLVRAIDVTCRCGHKMRVWCAYEPE